MRILVIETRMLGDAVLSLPFIRACGRECEVFVSCQPSAVPIMRMLVDAAHVLPWQPSWMDKSGERHLLDHEDRRSIDLLRNVHADLVVSVWPDIRIHLCMALLGVPQRVGFSMTADNFYGCHLGWRRRQLLVGKWGSVLAEALLMKSLLTKSVHRHSPQQHHLENWKQMAEAVGMTRHWDTTTPWVDPESDGIDSGLREFISRNDGHPGGLWLLNPGGRNASKRWPIRNFEQVVQDVFLAQKIPLIIVHPPDAEAPRINGATICHYTPQSVKDLSLALGAVKYVLSNDSVAAHLAAALSKTVVVIMGPTNPCWFAPFGSQHVIISGTGGCHYQPCMDVCRQSSFLCMNSVRVETVVCALRRLVSDSP